MIHDINGKPRYDLDAELERCASVARDQVRIIEIEPRERLDPFAFFKGVIWAVCITLIFMSFALMLWLG